MIVQRVLHLVSMTMVRVYAWLMLRMDVFWQAPFPAGPKLIVANHPSTTDPFYLGLLSHQPISLLIIESLFLIPVFGAFLRWSGHIPVVPGKGRAAFDAAHRRLLRGRSVAIFPEGDLSPAEGGCCRPRTGAARLALLTGVPIIPVGVTGTEDRVVKDNLKHFRRSKVDQRNEYADRGGGGRAERRVRRSESQYRQY